MEDRVWYAPPLGPIGRLAQAVVIAPMLKRIFGFRTHAMRARFGLADPGAHRGSESAQDHPAAA